MNMAETASNISAQAKADPISDFRINEKSVVPIWIQIRKRLVYLISSGKFERGERLPSVRELSVQLGVNYNTVNKVYQDLERDGTSTPNVAAEHTSPTSRTLIFRLLMATWKRSPLICPAGAHGRDVGGGYP